MQQAQFGDDIQFSVMLCDNNNVAKLLCSRENCRNCALTCTVQSCPCNSNPNLHQDCQFVNIESIVKKVIKKKRVITKEVEQGLQAVLRAYQSIIDELSNDKHKLIVWKEGYGLSYQQATLVNSVRDNSRTELIGDLVHKVKISLGQNVGEANEWFTSAEFEQFWKRQQKRFNKIRKQLQQFYQSALKSFSKIDLKMDFSFSSAYKYNEQTNTIQKITGNNDWQTLVGEHPLPKRNKVSFDVTIVKTVSRNLMIGIVTQIGRSMKTVYSSGEAICYYTYNGYLYSGTTSRQLGAAVNAGTKMTIQIDRINKQLRYYAQEKILGTVNLNEKFLTQQIYILVEGYDVTDSFRIQRSSI